MNVPVELLVTGCVDAKMLHEFKKQLEKFIEKLQGLLKLKHYHLLSKILTLKWSPTGRVQPQKHHSMLLLFLVSLCASTSGSSLPISPYTDTSQASQQTRTGRAHREEEHGES